MSIPVVGRSPIIDRWRDAGGSMDGLDAVRITSVTRTSIQRRRGALKVSVLAFLAVLGSTLLGVQIMPSGFAATSVVSFMPRPRAQTSADTVRLLGEKYVVLATSATIMQTAGDAIQAPPEELVRATTASLRAGTGNLEITVIRAGRQQAVDAANAVADVVVRRSRYDELVQAESTSPAAVSRTVARPARLLLRSAAVLAAVLSGMVVWTYLRGGRAGTGVGIGAGVGVGAGARAGTAAGTGRAVAEVVR